VSIRSSGAFRSRYLAHGIPSSSGQRSIDSLDSGPPCRHLHRRRPSAIGSIVIPSVIVTPGPHLSGECTRSRSSVKPNRDGALPSRGQVIGEVDSEAGPQSQVLGAREDEVGRGDWIRTSDLCVPKRLLAARGDGRKSLTHRIIRHQGRFAMPRNPSS